MSKIKVSKEVAVALELAIKVSGKERLLDDHFSCMNWKLKEYQPLNEISNWKMAQILINGYEVEETPEEKLVKLYKEIINSENYKRVNQQGFYDRGFIDGIEYTLKMDNRKIKGIND